MRRKFILPIIIVILLCKLIISLCSCHKDDNNPIIQNDTTHTPTQPDTASRYIWEKLDYHCSVYYVYVADTNAIYFVLLKWLYLFDGTNITQVFNLPNFFVKKVYGFDKNNIFVIGEYYKNNKYIPCVTKITNGNLQSYYFDNEINLSYDILVTEPNQAWLSSHNESKVYYYNNGNIDIYRLNTNDSINSGTFYKDQNNNIFVFCHKFPPSSDDSLFTYKFNGIEFELFRTDIINYYNPESKSSNIYRCGNDLIMLPRGYIQKLYYFDGNNWITHSYPFDTQVQFKVGGVSKDSLVSFIIWEDNIYTWGTQNKWRKENNSPPLCITDDGYTNVEAKFGNIYIPIVDESISSGCLLIGKPNKTQSF
jgi:hypothetical protein